MTIAQLIVLFRNEATCINNALSDFVDEIIDRKMLIIRLKSTSVRMDFWIKELENNHEK